MRIGLALLAVAAVLTAGCDAQTGTDTPQDTSPPPVALWDPCTEVSDSTLQSAGLDPATKSNTIGGVENVEGWELCSWKNQGPWDYSVGVWSTSHTIDEIRANPVNTDFRDVTVAGRSAVQHGVTGSPAANVCYLQFPAGAQVLSVSVTKTISGDNPMNPCTLATNAAEVIAPELPQ